MSYLSDLLGSNYHEGMSLDDVSKALETVGHGSDAELNRLKNQLSKANAEAADYKKQLRSKQTEDEASEAARKEEHDKLVKEVEELRRSSALSDRKGKLLAMGYEEALATATATAMVDGDMDTVLENQGKYLEAQKKAMLADEMRKTPRPAAGADPNSGMDYSKMMADAQARGDFSAMAYYNRLNEQEKASQTDS